MAPSSTGRGAAPARTRRSRDDAPVAALREGDEAAFADLVARWTPTMLRLALVRAPTRAVAEEVVQEAWLTVLRGLERFEGRSSLKTWVLGIVVNLARSRARSERRSAPIAPDETAAGLDPRRFRSSHAPRYPGHWALGPTPWPAPEEQLLAGEMRTVIFGAIAALPPAQREVLVLRDVEGCSAAEACDVLGIGESNQRVLLHRARTRVRSALEDYFEASEPT